MLDQDDKNAKLVNYNRDYYKKNRHRFVRRRQGLRRDLRQKRYSEMVATHGDACRICGKKEKLVIDHNHITGEIRGLLCSNCNLGIGLLGDSADLLRAAAKYLDSYPWEIGIPTLGCGL